MKTIQNLLDKYHERAAKVAAQMSEVERQEADISNHAPVAVPKFTVPDYVRDVIHPVLKMLAEALPEYPVHVPPPGSCYIEDGHYKIRVGVATLGGLSRLTDKDHRLYFISLFKKRALEKTEIRTIDELVSIVKAELNKRGMLVLPQEPKSLRR